MRRIGCVLALLLLAWPVLAQDWIEQLDIPLMPELALEPDTETLFETATGRVVLIEASGEVAPGAVRRYYATALPGLGWMPESRDAYIREQERLVIEIEQQGSRTHAGFRLAPR